MIDHYRKKIEEKQSEISILTNQLNNIEPTEKIFVSNADVEFYMRYEKLLSQYYGPKRLIPSTYKNKTAYHIDFKLLRSPYEKLEKFITVILILIIICIHTIVIAEDIDDGFLDKSIFQIMFVAIAILTSTYFITSLATIFVLLSIIFPFLRTTYLVLNRKSIKKHHEIKNILETNKLLEKQDFDDIGIIQQNIEISSKDLLYYQKCFEKAQKDEVMKIVKQKKLEAEKKIQEEENRRFQKKAEFWLKLNGYDFETEIAKLFSRKGYKVQQTSFSGDGGADLIVMNTDGEKSIIQCKNHKNPVSPHTIRDLLGTLIDFEADYGILINTGGFSQRTYEFALKHPITLYDIEDIVRIANS